MKRNEGSLHRKTDASPPRADQHDKYLPPDFGFLPASIHNHKNGIIARSLGRAIGSATKQSVFKKEIACLPVHPPEEGRQASSPDKSGESSR